MRVWYICHKFLTYKKLNLRVAETHVFYSLCFNRHLKRILYKRGWKNPYLVSSKIKRRPTPATSTTPRTRLTDLQNSDNFHKQYYNHITPTCHDKSHLDLHRPQPAQLSQPCHNQHKGIFLVVKPRNKLSCALLRILRREFRRKLRWVTAKNNNKRRSTWSSYKLQNKLVGFSTGTTRGEY